MTTKINNRYELLEWINEGGESVIYKALDHETSKTVVIKRTKYGLHDAQQQWTRQTSLLIDLQHTQVVQLLDCFVHRIEMIDYGMMVFEYVNGQTLEQEASTKRYTQQEVRQIILELLSIVVALQRLTPPILHRDIKPSNIIRDGKSGQLLLLDFGMATDYFPSDLGHTVGVGTIGYQAPEQIHGFPNLNSDIYSIGVIAVELLSKRKARELLDGNMINWSRLRPSLTTPWSSWLEKVLCPTEFRYLSAQDAFSALSGQTDDSEVGDTPSTESETDIVNNTEQKGPEQLYTVSNRHIFWMCVGSMLLGMLPIPFILYYHHKRRNIPHSFIS